MNSLTVFFFLLLAVLRLFRPSTPLTLELGGYISGNVHFDLLALEDKPPSNNIYTVTQDTDNFGILPGLLRNFQKYQPYEISKGSPVNFVYEDRAGNLWLGTNNSGMVLFDRTQEQSLYYQTDPINPDSLNENYVEACYEDRSGLLWFGTNSAGLNILNPASQQFTHYRHHPLNPNSLGHNKVIDPFMKTEIVTSGWLIQSVLINLTRSRSSSPIIHTIQQTPIASARGIISRLSVKIQAGYFGSVFGGGA